MGAADVADVQAFMEQLAAGDEVFRRIVVTPLSTADRRPLLLVRSCWAHAECYPNVVSRLGAHHAPWNAHFGDRVLIVERDPAWPKSVSGLCAVCTRPWVAPAAAPALLAFTSLWKTEADRAACPVLSATTSHKRPRDAAARADEHVPKRRRVRPAAEGAPPVPAPPVPALPPTEAPAAPAARSGLAVIPSLRVLDRAPSEKRAAAALRGSTSDILTSRRGAVVCHTQSTDAWRSLCAHLDDKRGLYGRALARRAFEPGDMAVMTTAVLGRLAQVSPWMDRFYRLLVMLPSVIQPQLRLFRATLQHRQKWSITVRQGSFFCFFACRQRLNVEMRADQPVDPTTPLAQRPVVDLFCAQPHDVQGNPTAGTYSALGCFVLDVRDFTGTITLSHLQPQEAQASYMCGTVSYRDADDNDAFDADLFAPGTTPAVADHTWHADMERHINALWRRNDLRAHQLLLACGRIESEERAAREQQKTPEPEFHPFNLGSVADHKRALSWLHLPPSDLTSDSRAVAFARALVSEDKIKWRFTDDKGGIVFYVVAHAGPVNLVMRRRRDPGPKDRLYLQIEKVAFQVRLVNASGEAHGSATLAFELAPMHTAVAAERHETLVAWSKACEQWDAHLQRQPKRATPTDLVDTLERLAAGLWGDPVTAFDVRADLECEPLHGGGKSPTGRPAPYATQQPPGNLRTGIITWAIRLVHEHTDMWS